MRVYVRPIVSGDPVAAYNPHQDAVEMSLQFQCAINHNLYSIHNEYCDTMDPASLTPKVIAEIFRHSAPHQTALWTLTEAPTQTINMEQKRRPNRTNRAAVAADIIKSFMAYGYVVWKTSKAGKLDC